MEPVITQDAAAGIHALEPTCRDVRDGIFTSNGVGIDARAATTTSAVKIRAPVTTLKPTKARRFGEHESRRGGAWSRLTTTINRMSNPFLRDLLIQPPSRPCVFVSYHHADQEYKDGFVQWAHTDNRILQDHSLQERLGSIDPEYLHRKIREDRIAGSTSTVVLVGLNTYRRKFVDWEIKSTLDRQNGLIGVVLPGVHLEWRGQGTGLLPWRLYDNLRSEYAELLDWDSMTPQSLLAALVRARNAPATRINNSREMLSRNV